MAQFAPSLMQRTVAQTGLYDAFPSVCSLPDGTVVAVWRQSAQHVATDEATVWAARSTAGASWSAPFVIAQEAGVAFSSAGIVAWPDGEIVTQVMRNPDPENSATRETWLLRSTDGGLTWGALEPGVQPAGSAKFAAGLALHDDGTLNGVLIATHYVTGAYLATSTDRGVTWSTQSRIVANGTRVYQEPQITTVGGLWICMLRTEASGSEGGDDALYLSTSADGGTTWTTPVRKFNNASGMPTVWATPDDTLLLIYRTPPLGAENGGGWGWATSGDLGQTWEAQDASALGPPLSMYGGWADLPDGSVICVYARQVAPQDADVYSQVFTLVDETPEEPPGPVLPTASTAAARSSVTWLACDMVTGRVLADLPELRGQIGRVVGRYTSTSLTLPIPLAGPATLRQDVFEEATEPGVRMLVAVINDVPSWGGLVLTRDGGTDATLNLGCVTLEGYLERRYVGDHVWLGVDQASVIAAGLIGDANDVEGIDLTIDAPKSGTTRRRRYYDKDDTTVYQRLRELAAVQGGPEWTIDLEWADDSQTTIAKVIRVHDRIGKASDSPNALFEARSNSETTYSHAEDYTSERGANDVMATGSGEGEDRPQSKHHRDVRPGWPRYERRFAADTGSDDPDVLDDHAAAELTLMAEGAKTWTISSRWDKPPRLNLDWALGDDIAWELVGHRHPNGATGRGRAIGWNLDLQSGIVEPVLWAPNEEAS